MQSDSLKGQLFELRKMIRAIRPDIVHTALFRADQLGRVASVLTGARVVSSLVNTPYVDERLGDPNVVRWRLRAAQAVDAATSRLFVDRFHAVSDGVKSENARDIYAYLCQRSRLPSAGGMPPRSASARPNDSGGPASRLASATLRP